MAVFLLVLCVVLICGSAGLFGVSDWLGGWVGLFGCLSLVCLLLFDLIWVLLGVILVGCLL